MSKENKYTSMLDKMRAYLESDEGKEATKRFIEKTKKEDLFRKRWSKKFIKVLKEKSEKDLEILYESYLVHNKKRSDILWKQGIDGDSSLNSFILNAFAELGSVCEDEMFGMFTAQMFKYKDYTAELVVGQGSYISIQKIK